MTTSFENELARMLSNAVTGIPVPPDAELRVRARARSIRRRRTQALGGGIAAVAGVALIGWQFMNPLTSVTISSGSAPVVVTGDAGCGDRQSLVDRLQALPGGPKPPGPDWTVDAREDAVVVRRAGRSVTLPGTTTVTVTVAQSVQTEDGLLLRLKPTGQTEPIPSRLVLVAPTLTVRALAENTSGDAAVSPDGHRIAYLSHQGGEAGPPIVRVVDLRTGSRQAQLTDLPSGSSVAAWGPRGLIILRPPGMIVTWEPGAAPVERRGDVTAVAAGGSEVLLSDGPCYRPADPYRLPRATTIRPSGP